MSAGGGITVGLRVVRGDDWQWKDQDGGEGFVGTVVEIGGQGSSKNPDNTVVVVWDTGSRANYRTGYEGKDDLRVLDNAPAGVRHTNITCDICRLNKMSGIRWKCTECHDFDLCHVCYMSNKHDLSHVFIRFDTPLSVGVQVPQRSSSRTIQAKGIYPGAKVARGPDWADKYKEQDGGSGKQGSVVSVNDAPDDQSYRSWVKVKWDAGGTNDYRRGYEGLLDVKCSTAAKGELYYVAHLPKLGDYASNLFQTGDAARLNPDHMSADYKASLQQSGLLNLTGRVSVNADGESLTISFPNNSLTVSAAHLTKVCKLSPGDTARILNDEAAVRAMQSGHGGWSTQMKNVLGKTGTVVSVDRDGDVKVDFAGPKWIFNPQCCILVSQGQGQVPSARASLAVNTQSSSDDDDDDTDANNPLGNFLDLMQLLLGAQYAGLHPASLVKEAMQGNTDNVRRILTQHPAQVNVKTENRTALQVAAHQGHKDVVILLLKAGADAKIQDDDGDSAFHYAAFGNKPDAMDLMLKKSTAGMNAVNKAGRTSLHVAVCKQHAGVVRVLLSYRCDVNVQDVQGDTALHDAVSRNSDEIINMLIAHNDVDFKLKNQKGFNVLHDAARHGDVNAVERIIRKAPQFVNVPKEDGFTALHIAALNGYIRTATVLIDTGKANIEMTTSKYHTPLLVAVDSGQTPLIEFLVNKGANLEAEDSDGDTALHLVLLQMKNSRQAASAMTFLLNVLFRVQPKNIENAPAINKIYEQFTSTPDVAAAWLAIACFLVSSGADVNHKNRANKSPIDEVADSKIKQLLQKFVKSKPRPPIAAKPQPAAAAGGGKKLCMMCTTEPIAVTFRPCGHQVACSQCSARMKQCFSCHERIQEKVRMDIQAHGRPATAPGRASSNAGVQRQVKQLADTVNCPLCEQNVRSVVFQCGHSCCKDCSDTRVQSSCHVCGTAIQKRINLF